ncbi:TPA: radical SAM protein, partial [Candidatus Bathyarchaeota archaeon]|nr:radical SAM protein [Candidatus Bathyarchaeota archaeon]
MGLSLKEAMFYEKVGDKRVRCTLCPHRCVILDSKRGICGVRENKG